MQYKCLLDITMQYKCLLDICVQYKYICHCRCVYYSIYYLLLWSINYVFLHSIIRKTKNKILHCTLHTLGILLTGNGGGLDSGFGGGGGGCGGCGCGCCCSGLYFGAVIYVFQSQGVSSSCHLSSSGRHMKIKSSGSEKK